MNDQFLQDIDPQHYPYISEHQAQIEEYYGGRAFRELRESEVRLLSDTDLILVAFSNRSGSTLLTELLNQSGLGVPPKAEVFNADSTIHVCREDAIESFTDYFFSAVSGWRRDGLAGFKVGPRQLFWLTRAGLLSHFRSIRIVNSRRRDLVAQAVSLCIAEITGQWQSAMDASAGPETVEYSPESILRGLETITQSQQLIEYYAQIHAIPRIEIYYEDLVADPRAQIGKVWEFLGKDSSLLAEPEISGVSIRSQYTAVNERLAALFRRDFSWRA